MKSNLFRKTSIFTLVLLISLSGCTLFGGNDSSIGDSQKEILREMQSKIQEREMKSGNIKGTATFNIDSKEESGTFALSIDSDFDVEKKGEEKVGMMVDFSGKGENEEGKMEGVFKGEMMILEKMLYFKLHEVVASSDKQESLQELIDMYVGKLKGKWWKTPLSEDAFETEYTSDLTEEQEEQLKELVGKSDFFELKEDKGTEKVNGKNTYHYVVDLDRDGITKFLTEMSKIGEKELSKEEVENIKNSLEIIVVKNAELWIGTEDKYIYKVVLSIVLKDQITGNDTNVEVELSYDPKSIELEAPADVEDFDPMMLMGGVTPPMTDEMMDLESMENLEGLEGMEDFKDLEDIEVPEM